MSKWKAFKDEYPKQKADSYGRMQCILVGARDPYCKFFSHQLAFVSVDDGIMMKDSYKEVNTTFFTHWMEIPEVPGETNIDD